MENTQTSSDLAEQYYDSESGFKYYSIINSPDYSGIAVYPEETVETGPDGAQYPRGAGVESVLEATLLRDKRMLNLILEHIPKGRKIRALEYGSGRGGLTRVVAKELMKRDLLELIVGSNISEKENEFNRQRAKEENFPESIYRVDHGSFDDNKYEDGSFDLVFSNDAYLHSSDKEKCMTGLCRILSKDGALVFSDIVESPTVDREALKEVYARLSLSNLGNHIQYDKIFTKNGLKKKLADVSSTPIIRHYGMVKYNATVVKKDALLSAGVTQDFVDKQVFGLGKWIESGQKGLVQQGWFAYRKGERERTYIMIKPDGVQRGLVGQIISRFETKGFKLVAMKLCMPGKAMFEKHYADLSLKTFFAGLVEYAASGPVCCMVWEGANAVLTGRKMLGATKPFDSNPGTIRGDFCIDVGRNICHGSDSVESANNEISLWFKPEELVSWADHSEAWVYE